jgi:hypothetical protein
MTLLLVILILLILLGGGGYYGYRSDYYGRTGFTTLVVLSLLIMISYLVFWSGHRLW